MGPRFPAEPGGLAATVLQVVRSAAGHRVPPMAGEAAFFAALAAFPTLLTVVALLNTAGSVFGAGIDMAAAHGLTSLMRLVLTDRGGAAADAAAELLDGSSRGLLTAGSAVALLLLARAMRSVLHSLTIIAERPRRHWSVALVLALVLLGGGSLAVAVAVVDPLQITGLPLWRVLRWPVLTVALLGWALLLLRIGLGAPRRRAGRGLGTGALVVVGGWFAASGLFPLYIAVAARYTPTFGALGGGLILLVWLYLLMLSLYLGAEVCRAVGAGPSGDRQVR